MSEPLGSDGTVKEMIGWVREDVHRVEGKVDDVQLRVTSLEQANAVASGIATERDVTAVKATQRRRSGLTLLDRIVGVLLAVAAVWAARYHG